MRDVWIEVDDIDLYWSWKTKAIKKKVFWKWQQSRKRPRGTLIDKIIEEANENHMVWLVTMSSPSGPHHVYHDASDVTQGRDGTN